MKAKIFTPGPGAHFAMNDNKNLFGKLRTVCQISKFSLYGRESGVLVVLHGDAKEACYAVFIFSRMHFLWNLDFDVSRRRRAARSLLGTKRICLLFDSEQQRSCIWSPNTNHHLMSPLATHCRPPSGKKEAGSFMQLLTFLKSFQNFFIRGASHFGLGPSRCIFWCHSAGSHLFPVLRFFSFKRLG